MGAFIFVLVAVIVLSESDQINLSDAISTHETSLQRQMRVILARYLEPIAINLNQYQ